MYFCESIFGEPKKWIERGGVLYGTGKDGKEVKIPKESIEKYMKDPKNIVKNFNTEFTPSFYGTFFGGLGGLSTYQAMLGDQYTPTQRWLATGAATLIPSVVGSVYSHQNAKNKLRNDIVNKYMSGKIWT